MPRASLDSNEPYAREIKKFANIKKNIPDVLFDLNVIYQFQLDRFRDMLLPEDLKLLLKKIQYLSSLNISPTTKSRIYIVTQMDYTPFVLVDMDERVVNHLITSFYIANIESNEEITPNYISTLFIFKNDKLEYYSDILPKSVAELSSVFKKENLYNFAPARNSLYGEPRRRS